MVLFFLLFVIIPILGVLWFLNLAYLLKKIKGEKDTRNQVLLGAVLTFFFIFTFMYVFAGVH
jgi:succinate-acetate transporter protein